MAVCRCGNPGEVCIDCANEELAKRDGIIAELEKQLNCESDAYALLRDENAALRLENERLRRNK